MSTAVESFFDITTGRNHGVVPTADALRVVLDSGATLVLDKAGGMVRARAGWPRTAFGWPQDLTAVQPETGGERTVELAVGDGAPESAIRGVVDMATGRRFGAPVRIVLDIWARHRTVTATLSYMRLKGAPDGMLSPNEPDAMLPILGDGGEPEVVTEKVRIGRVTAVGPADAKPSVEAAGERIDQALSALVGKLVLGESGVEVTEWVVAAEACVEAPDGGQLGVRFGWLTVPLFSPDEADADGDIAQKLVAAVELMRQHRGRGCRIEAIVVRVAGRDDLAGIACLPGRPDPPVGATLAARRLVGGAPSVDLTLHLGTFSNVEWGADDGAAQFRLRLAAEKLKQDAALAGLSIGHRVRLCLLSASGLELVHCVTELDAINTSTPVGNALELAIDGLAKRRAGKDYEDVTLRMTVVPERRPDGGVRDAKDAS